MVEERRGLTEGTSRIAKSHALFYVLFVLEFFCRDWIGSSTWVMRLKVCTQNAGRSSQWLARAAVSRQGGGANNSACCCWARMGPRANDFAAG